MTYRRHGGGAVAGAVARLLAGSGDPLQSESLLLKSYVLLPHLTELLAQLLDLSDCRPHLATVCLNLQTIQIRKYDATPLKNLR